MGDWIDTMLVCESGHQITSTLTKSPHLYKSRCPDCGKPTISKCPKCLKAIPGETHYEGVIDWGPKKPVPSFCDGCGEPYPWQAILAVRKSNRSESEKSAHSSTKVFIVHGHDESMKLAAARFLERLGLEPVILHEQTDGGKTIIEKFESHSEDVGFAVILLSPDDVGRAVTEKPKSEKKRARQNVIFELGYFVGILGRECVCVLKKEDVEIPSDFSGVVYTPFDSHDGWKMKLAKELKACGYPIDMNDVV